MPSTREPIQLLEPSDLLEPLDLRDHHANSVYALAYPEYGGTPSSASAHASVRASSPTPVPHGSRALKSALIVAGALACFGAGAALSQFPNVTFVDGNGSPTMASATPPAPRAADAAVRPDDPTPATTTDNAQHATTSNQAQKATASDAPQQSGTPPAKESAAPAAPACDAQGSPKDDSRCLAGATVQPAAASAKSTAASDPVPINPPAATQPIAQAETPPAADRARADTRPSGEKQQRAQSSRGSRRAPTPREAIDQRSIADNNVPSVRWSSRRQGGDANRASGDRRDWATDDSSATAYSAERWQNQDVSRWQERDNDRWQDRDMGRWQDRDAGRWQDRDAGRWQDRESDRAYGSRRDRYDAYSRGDDRGGARAWREDERMNSRPPQEAQPMFAPFRSGW
jgi:hypothetical protein